MAEKRGRKPNVKPTKKASPAPSKASKASKRPDPPSDLADVSLAAWRSLCDDLAAQQTIDKADRKLMETYCRLYATFRRIEKQLAEEPLTKVSAQNGRTFIHPLVNSQSDYANKLRQILNDLGLTPKSRKSPKGSGDESDPLDAYLKA